MARRLVAIMFTDVVDSTRLAQEDEKTTLRRLERQEELTEAVLAAHHGRLVKKMGDGMLVEFSNALEAVQCAVEIQRKSQEPRGEGEGPPLRLRIGIHVGDVEERGTDILGDAVNVAARLRPLADPGGVCFSSVVFEHVRNKTPFSLEKMGPRPLKGLLEPVDVYRVVLPWVAARVSSKGKGPPRLAVLPLANMSSDPENDYFADGMTEELISTISKIPHLDVISRTSVMRFKSAATAMGEIAQQLNVGWILEGSVRKAGNRVRTTVQLVDALADRDLWSENYDRGIEDVFAIQSEIAQKVAGELRIRLAESDTERIRRPPTQDTEAHLRYLRGLAREREYTADGFEAAIREYESAIAKDPKYATAYAGLTRCYFLLGYWEIHSAQTMADKAEQAARRAFELDPNLAEAHLAMAVARMGRPGSDPGEVRKAFLRAIELNANVPSAHMFLAMFMRAIGGTSTQEEREAAERALALDPLSPSTMEAVATTLLYSAKNVERAIQIFEEALRLDPTLPYARNNLGLCHVLQGRWDEGIAEIRKSIEMDQGFSAMSRADLIFAYVRAGRVDEARSALNELLEYRKTHRAGAVAIGLAYARLGDLDQAFAWFETALEEGATYLAEVRGELGLEKLRQDPRYLELLKRMGLARNDS